MAEYVLSIMYDSLASARRHVWLYICGTIILIIGLIIGIGIVDADKQIIIASSSGTLVVTIIESGSFIWVLGKQLLVAVIIALSLFLLSFFSATNYIKLALIAVIAIMGGVYIAIVCSIYSIIPSIITSLLIASECLLLSVAILQSICNSMQCNRQCNNDVFQLFSYNIASILVLVAWLFAKMVIIFILIRLFFVIF